MGIMAITEHAPAKVNLALHVTGRRADGYHLIDTLVVFCKAGDRISAREADADSFMIGGPFAAGLAAGGDNLVLRARDLMRRLAGPASAPVAIALEKNLPVASGIGGGSSDAAATLRALRRLWRANVADDALADAALALGADLPMCLAARPLRAGGIGETLTGIDGLPPLSMVLVNPGVAVSTPTVFAALARRDNPPLPPLPARPDHDTFIGWLRMARNDLQEPAERLAPAVGETLAALTRNGAMLARMSGSGATCFGIFASRGAADAAAARLAAARPSWYVTATDTVERNGTDGAH